MEKILAQTKLDFKTKKPRDVANRLSRMHDSGSMNLKTGNDENAFIFFTRWINAVEFILKSKDYRQNKSYYERYISNSQMGQVKIIVSRLEKSLTLKLAPPQLNIGSGIPHSTATEFLPESEKNREGSLNLPETPTEEPKLASDSDEFITCLQLFQLIQLNSRLLVIDVRSDKEYLASRIKSDQCINIPGDKIKAGLIASSFEKLLSNNKEARNLFSRRSAQYVDTLILIDWRSTRTTLFPDVPARALKDILQYWDPGTKIAKIKVLDGGYTEWLNCYPAYVTNSNVQVPDVSSTAMDEILEDVEYPEWINTDSNSSPFSQLRIQTLPPKNLKPKNIDHSNSALPTNKNNNRSYNNTTNSLDTTNNKRNGSTNNVNNEMDTQSQFSTSTEKFNNRYTEDVETDDEEIFTFPNNKYPNKSALHSSTLKPTVDRTSKPSNLTNRFSDCTTLLMLMRQHLELLKSEEDCESEILKIKMSHYREFDYNFDANAYVKTISTRLKEVKERKSEVKAKLLEENVDETSMSPKDKKEKHSLELKIGSKEQRLKELSLECAKIHEDIREPDQKRHNPTPKRNENGVHKEPLKSDGSSTNSGLKRSHSSPNLAQMDDRKIPHVDRSSKPLPAPEVPLKPKNQQKTASQYRSKGREDRMEPVYRDGHPGITGLKNLGNSCYMNSIIQCLSNTAYLARYFNDNQYIDHLNTDNVNGTQSLVADEVAHVIKALWRGQYKSISPRDLKIVIGQYKLQFDTTEQQDSHEFLTFLLDWMHNDLKREAKTRVAGPLSPAEKEWDKAMEGRQSKISDLFFGQLRSSIICATCGNSSITYETFNSLTMSLPHANRCSLDDCVKKYVSGQKVSGWKCPNCKVPREATKKFDFIKLAPIVVIHLNRFAETDGWLEKKNTSVEFPLTDFDLKPYLVPDLESTNTPNKLCHNYSLYAMSNHYGTMDGGHYTAFCKSAPQNKWYKFDDHTVSEVDRAAVKCQTASAYLLFYTSITSEQFSFR